MVFLFKHHLPKIFASYIPFQSCSNAILIMFQIHFVHWNVDLYKSAGDAGEKEGGLAVIGVFVEVGDHEHEELEKIAKLMDNIKYKDDKVVLNECIHVDKLMPKSWYFNLYITLTLSIITASLCNIIFRTELLHLQRLSNNTSLFGICHLDCFRGAIKGISKSGMIIVIFLVSVPVIRKLLEKFYNTYPIISLSCVLISMTVNF